MRIDAFRHIFALPRAPEVVPDLIKQFASVVGPECVIARTDCGVATFIYLTVNEKLALAKLRSLSEGAAMASRDLY
jgi:5-methyltetrahydropteroyltriglutamate--homocysteine methyltransferase